jgi:hypothetical protein
VMILTSNKFELRDIEHIYYYAQLTPNPLIAGFFYIS